MKSSHLLKQYVWIVDTIGRSSRITLRDLSRLYEGTALSEGQSLNRNTFKRHREAIADLFGLVIDCDSENRYYIADSTPLVGDSVPRWMVSTLAVSNIVGEARGLHDRILLESIPSETEHLSAVVEAMQRSQCLQIDYRRYGSAELQQWHVEPYCIKLFRRRWYLLGRVVDGWMIILSFDRMQQVSSLDEPFVVDPVFDASAFFAEYFGVMTDDRVPLQRIVLRAFGNERFALRDLPLHPSQRELSVGENYVDFELRLRPTSDFLAHLLSRGRWLKVIEPSDIALRIKQMHKEAAAEYENI